MTNFYFVCLFVFFPPHSKAASKSEDHGATLYIIVAAAVAIVIVVGVAVYCRYLHLLF